MKQIKEIMEDIRGMPVCPRTGEENLYCVIQKHIGDERVSEILRQRNFFRGRDQHGEWKSVL